MFMKMNPLNAEISHHRWKRRQKCFAKNHVFTFCRVEFNFPNVRPICYFHEISIEFVCCFSGVFGSGYKSSIICVKVWSALKVYNKIINEENKEQGPEA